MAVLLYGLLLTLLYPVYRLASLFSGRLGDFQRTRQAGRRALGDFFATKPEGVRTFWLHGSSAGELDQALAVARELRQRETSVRILITVFSLSVKRLPKPPDADLACYLPLDLPWAWQFLVTGPDVFVTFTWDVFPNLLARLRKLGSRSYLSSAALADDSWRLRRARFLRPFYEDLDGIGVVDAPNRDRFLRLFPHLDRVQITGDTRYDTIFHRLEQAPLDPPDARILEACQPLLILASTYRACEDQLFPYLAAWMSEHSKIDVWIFPHHVNEERLRECEVGLDRAKLKAIRYSALLPSRNHRPPRLVLVDRLGLLARWYAKARYCYVGGAFHNRIHNTAEPAALGALVMTGPRIEDSPIAVQLEALGTLFRHSSGADIFQHLSDLERDKNRRRLLAESSRRFLMDQRGASSRFLAAFRL